MPPVDREFVRTVDTPAGPGILDAWQSWLRAHYIDPSDVLMGHPIERWPGERLIVYEALNRGHDCGAVAAALAARRLSHRHAVKLNSAPLPFPTVGG